MLSSASSENKAGADEAKRVEAQVGLVTDTQFVDYVTAIGQRLVSEFPENDTTYTFAVVDMPEPNAFALPGGFVYVSRGLLALVNSEDELATVIAHEIGHVAAHHASRRLTVAAPFAIVTGITSFATSIVSPLLGNVVAGIGGLTTNLVVAPYSREQEREADSLGMELAARSGWDPAALGSILHTMERDEKLHGSKASRFSFLSSHPSTPERVRAATEQASELTIVPHDPIAADRTAVLRRLDGLVIGNDPAGGVIADNRFLHPELDLALEFPDGWKIENGRAAVAAIAPKGDALSMMRSAEAGEDLTTVVRRAATELGVGADTEIERTTIAGDKAARFETAARTQEGTPVQLYLTCIDHHGAVLEVLGICALDRAATYANVLKKVPKTLRSLAVADWPYIQATRLRLETASGGDTVTKVVVRSKSAWRPDEAAVANGVETNSTLADGFTVKLAVTEPYRKGAAK